MTKNPCETGRHAAPKRALTDARGIFCGYVCDACEASARENFRPEIFGDAGYWTDEPIDDEDA